MFRWLRLGDDAAYADHRWNLYGTFSGIVTVATRDNAQLIIQNIKELVMVEPDGIEPTTSSMPLKRSPN